MLLAGKLFLVNEKCSEFVGNSLGSLLIVQENVQKGTFTTLKWLQRTTLFTGERASFQCSEHCKTGNYK
jgi:hypothetical protein